MSRLIPKSQVRAEFGVSSMTLWRWTRDPDLNFPQPVVIRRRKYRDADAIEAFQKAQREKGETVASPRRTEAA